MFAAHRPLEAQMVLSSGRNASRRFYFRDEPVRVLGCASRYQFCRADASAGAGCTPLVGRQRALLLATRLWHGKTQQRLFVWLTSLWETDYVDVWNVPRVLGLSALTARYSLFNGLQGPLPANQWLKEVEHWFMTSLASLQRIVLEVVTGPLDPKLDKLLVRPTTAEERLLCRNQVSC
jgi:hypothetical protein